MMFLKMILATLLAVLLLSSAHATVYVAPGGDDAGDGSVAHPVASLTRALALARTDHAIELRSGIYHLDSPVVIRPEDSGTAGAPLTIAVEPNGHATLSGARVLPLSWSTYRNGIYQAEIPGDVKVPDFFDALFVNGSLQTMARYPNFDPQATPYNGVAADAISPARIATWKHPETGVLNAMHTSLWGDMHYRITGVGSDGNAILGGGDQMLGGKLGLRPFDVISAVNDHPVATIADFQRDVAAAKGAAVNLTILHGQHTRQVKYDLKQ